jgi:hypothetical protein
MWGVRNIILQRSINFILIILSVLTVLIFLDPAYSLDIYEWTDEKGVKHFSNTEARVPEQYRNKSNSVEFKGNYNVVSEPDYNYYENTDEIINTFQETEQVYKIPFIAYEGGARRIIVPVTINSTVTAQLAIDTGSPGMIISEGLAKKLGLYENDSGMLMSVASGIGGQVAVMRTIIDKVQMGGATENFVPAIITSSMSNAFEGLIGMDFMANYSISIDNVNNFIILQQNPVGSDLPAGHSKNWWRRSFAEFRTYQKEWQRIKDLINDWERKSRLNIDMTDNDVKKLKNLAIWQYQESSKLLQRLERYAQQNNVPQNWRN